MYRLEFSEGSADKFWQIERNKTEVLLSWGRKGSSGQSQQKSFATEAEAESFLQQQLIAKLKKGYLQVTEANSPAQAASVPSVSSKQACASVQATPSSQSKTAVSSTDTSNPLPPVANNTALIPTIVWPAKLRDKELIPKYLTYSYPSAIKELTPPVNQVAAWLKLGPELAKTLENKLWKGSADWQETGKQLRRMAQMPMPESLSQEQASAILMLSNRRESVDFIWQTLGAQTTLQAWLLSRYLEQDYRFDPESKRYVFEISQSEQVSPFCERDLGPQLWALRMHIAALEPQAYSALKASLAVQRQSPLSLRLALDWIFWNEADWLAEDIAEWLNLADQPPHKDWNAGWMLWPWLKDPQQLEQIAQRFMSQAQIQHDFFDRLSQALEPNLYWLPERAGLAAASSIYAWIIAGKRASMRKKAVQALKLLPLSQTQGLWFELLKHKDAGKEAYASLSSEPLQGIRALIQGLKKRRNYPQAEQLLAALLRGLSATELSQLRQDLGTEAEHWLPAAQNHIQASSEALPDYFSQPPWQAPALKLPQFKDLQLPQGPAEMDFLNPLIRRERSPRPYISNKPPLTAEGDHKVMEWIARRAGCLLSDLDYLSQDKALELWNTEALSFWSSRERDPWDFCCLARRFGLAGLPGFLRHLDKVPEPVYEALSFFNTPQIVPHMLRGLLMPAVRDLCSHWFLRRPESALRGLIPMSLNPAWDQQTQALRMVQLLSQRLKSFPDMLTSILNEFKAEEQIAFRALLAEDPLKLLPPKLPKLPAFLKPELLPLVRLNSGELLPGSANLTLAMSLLLDQPALPYAGIARVRELCEPASLEAFALALWELWLGDGGKLKHEWAFWGLAAYGGTEAVRQMVPRIEKWPGERSVQRALLGLEILRQMEQVDNAWPELHRLSLKTRYPSVQERAREIIQQLALLNPEGKEVFGDRLVPHLGLDAQSSRNFDFGSGSWRAVLNQAAKLELYDPAGRIQAKAPAKGMAEVLKTYKQFAKDLNQQLVFQRQRLEQAMYQGRRWKQSHFERYLIKHPLLQPLIRTLIWGAYTSKEDRPQQLFRLGAEGFLDATGQPLQLDAHMRIGLVHPLEMLPQLQLWRQTLQALGITQAIEQLERQTYVPALADLTKDVLPEGGQTDSAKVLKLISQSDWKAPKQSEGELEKDLGRGWEAELSLEYKLFALKEYPKVDVFHIRLRRKQNYAGVRLEDAHPIAYSELKRDLVSLGFRE